MISSRHHFVYIHVPKTGGNSIQRVLLPYSDDRIVTHGHQDGVDRFEIKGPVTRSKHNGLDTYAKVISGPKRYHRIIIGVRHPFERLLSFYFSPNRWMVREQSGNYRCVGPDWSRAAFMQFAQKIPAAWRYLVVGQQIIKPDHVVRFEHLHADFDAITGELGLPIDSTDLPHANKSTIGGEAKAAARADLDLKVSIERLFKADMNIFGYAQLDAPTATSAQ